MKEINTIYIVKNTINNKVYVGQTWETISKRFGRHKYGSTKDYKNLKLPKFYSAIKKYGVENFYIEAIASSKTQENANYLEGHFIELFDSVNNGYNLMSGGGSYGKHSEETKQKMRIAASKLPSKKGIPISDEHKIAISKANMGKTRSDEQKKSQSIRAIGSSNNFYGKTHTQETLEKIRTSNTGRKLLPQDILKRTETNNGISMKDFYSLTIYYSLDNFDDSTEINIAYKKYHRLNIEKIKMYQKRRKNKIFKIINYENIIKLHLDGFNSFKISKELKISYQTVCRYIIKFKNKED